MARMPRMLKIILNMKNMIIEIAGLLFLAASVVRAAEAASPEDLQQRIAQPNI
jgi:hypothetical protein